MSHDHSAEISLALPHAFHTECHLVAGTLEHLYGWSRQDEGAYVGDGRFFLHIWNRLPDGCILDATFAQCGDHSVQVNVVGPGDPGYGDYLPWWCLTHGEYRRLYLDDPHPGMEYAGEGARAFVRGLVPPEGRAVTEDGDPDYLRDC